MSVISFVFFNKNRKQLEQFLLDTEHLGFIQSSENQELQLIKSYYVGYCSREIYHTYVDIPELIFKVKNLIDEKFPKITFKYCYYGDNCIVNTDIDCEYIGMRYRLFKKTEHGSSSNFFKTLEEVKDGLQKFISSECHLECPEKEIAKLPLDLAVLQKFCNNYEVELSEVLHCYPGLEDFDAKYAEWKEEQLEALREEKENKEYEGNWYDDYDVNEKLKDIDYVFEYLEHHYRHDKANLKKVTNCRTKVAEIRKNFGYDDD